MKQNKTESQWGYKDIFKDPSIYITLLIAGLIAMLGNETVLRCIHVELGIAMTAISSTLLGIIIAGLAIFLAFLDKKYIALIDEVFGIGKELLPIKVTTILAIICLSLSLGLILIGNPITIVFRLILLFALWSYSYLLWQIWELVQWLVEHAKARAMQVRNEEKK